MVHILEKKQKVNPLAEPRLAVCHVCNTIERMPAPPAEIPLVPARVETESGEVHTFTDDQGMAIMVPEYDPVLEDFVGRHGHGLDDVSGMGAIAVFPVDPKTWAKVDVVSELKKELMQVTNEFYEESNHYREEALKCYQAHDNPGLNECHDYCDDSKIIGGSTRIPKKHRTYLCYMCPVQQSYVNVELRRRKGWYDPANDRKLQVAKRHNLGPVKKV